MAQIEEIPGINGATLDLLRAAGIHRAGDLVSLGHEELLERLEEANARDQLVARLPAISALKAWRSAAKVLEGGPGRERTKLPSDLMKKVRSPGLPTARQMSSAQLREAGISAAEVPIGTLLAEVSAEMEEAADRATTASSASSQGDDGKESEERVVGTEQPDRPAEAGEGAPGAESAAGSREERARPAPKHLRVRELGASRPAELREEFSPLASSEPAQRRLEKRNHGMLHREPSRVYVGALATLLAMFLGGAGFIVVVGALFYAFYNEVAVPWWTLLVLPAFPLAVVLHVTLGLRPRCRLCGQQLFRPKSCNKHVKAHRSPFGPIFAVALHAVTRGWFRCMLCGTKQRLHE